MKNFKIATKQGKTPRHGILTTPHGKLKTPFFMTIGTRGAVKNITPKDLDELNTPIILSNTYHLIQRPGLDILKHHKGLHNFMQWHKPILTDSGGYQVFSLAQHRKITEKGVEFSSEIDGKKILLTPESVIDAQLIIGSDIIMILDECPPHPSTYEYTKKSLERTLRWAERARTHFDKKMKQKRIPPAKRPLLFGIIQGGMYKDLREHSAQRMQEIGFDGYAIGGVAVGEPLKEKKKQIEWATPLLPEDKPRYLMGLGKPEEIVYAVHKGVDMFDCVIPTREARHGRLYVRTGTLSLTKPFYKLVNIRKETFKKDKKPIDAKCACYTCKTYSRSYIRHLFSINEGLGLKLTTLHNINFYLRMMEELQQTKKTS